MIFLGTAVQKVNIGQLWKRSCPINDMAMEYFKLKLSTKNYNTALRLQLLYLQFWHSWYGTIFLPNAQKFHFHF